MPAQYEWRVKKLNIPEDLWRDILRTVSKLTLEVEQWAVKTRNLKAFDEWRAWVNKWLDAIEAGADPRRAEQILRYIITGTQQRIKMGWWDTVSATTRGALLKLADKAAALADIYETAKQSAKQAITAVTKLPEQVAAKTGKVITAFLKPLAVPLLVVGAMGLVGLYIWRKR